MSDRTCPLGEDCDLTVAWMAGAEDQRKHMHRRMAEAADRISALEAALAKADELAGAMELLMASSEDDADTLGIADDALTAYRQASDATR